MLSRVSDLRQGERKVLSTRSGSSCQISRRTDSVHKAVDWAWQSRSFSKVSRKGVVCFVVGDKKKGVAPKGHELWKLPVITAGVTFFVDSSNKTGLLFADGLHKSVDKQPTCWCQVLAAPTPRLGV